MPNDPGFAPIDVGENVRDTVQVLPLTSEAPHVVLVSANEASPLLENEIGFRSDSPVFLMVTVFATGVLPV